MKQQRLLLAVGLVGICILAWWLFFSQPSKSVKEDQQQKRGQAAKSQQPQQVVPPEQKVQKSKNEGMREGLSLLNHQPIEFYGRAVDQYGEPVVGAEVRGHVQINDGYRETLEKHQTTTDSNGMFEFHGFSGRDLGIAVSKSGYLRESEHTANSYFKYSLMFREKVHKPDSANPVVFKMWKLAGAEPMVEVEGFYGVSVDGKTYTFDLLHKKKIESADGKGDLRIKVNRPVQIEPKSKYDWSFVIEAVDGGIRETDETFKYLAPEGGYQSFLEVPINAEDPGWSERVKKSIYFRSRGGKIYGRLDIEVFSNYQNDGVFRVKGYINPSGSRNLEYDPRKNITPQRIAQIGLEKAIEEARDPDERERKHLESLGIPSSGK